MKLPVSKGHWAVSMPGFWESGGGWPPPLDAKHSQREASRSKQRVTLPQSQPAAECGSAARGVSAPSPRAPAAGSRPHHRACTAGRPAHPCRPRMPSPSPRSRLASATRCLSGRSAATHWCLTNRDDDQFSARDFGRCSAPQTRLQLAAPGPGVRRGRKTPRSPRASYSHRNRSSRS